MTFDSCDGWMLLMAVQGLVFGILMGFAIGQRITTKKFVKLYREMAAAGGPREGEK